MRTASAHKGILSTIRHKLALWLHEPTETPWQRFRTWGYDAPEPAPAPIHIPLIDGIAGGQPLSWPVGTYSAVRTGRLPHLHREPDMLAAPVERQDGWINSKPGREELFADVVDVPDESEEDDGDAPTVLAPKTIRNRQFSEAIDGLKGA